MCLETAFIFILVASLTGNKEFKFDCLFIKYLLLSQK